MDSTKEYDLRNSLNRLMDDVANADEELTRYREHSFTYSPIGEQIRAEALDNAREALVDFVKNAIENGV